jgi:hypothetical protein
MEPAVIALIIAANLAIVGGGFAWKYFKSDRWRLSRALKKAARVPLADVRDGDVVRVTGRARAAEEEPFGAPLSGRACLAYEVEVEEYVQHGRSGKWKSIIHETDHVDAFWLVEPRARARVQCVPASLVLDRDAKFRSGVLREPDQTLIAYLANHGQQHQGMIFNRNLRYREGIIEPGEEVTVLAVARSEPDPDPASTADGYRGRAMRMVLRSPAHGDLIISDMPGLTRRK